MKRYAPDKPDSSLHRPGDTNYLRELLTAAGLSQRKAGPLLGMDERSMRYKVAGEKPLSYPEQYCLEVLADIGINVRRVAEHGGPDVLFNSPGDGRIAVKCKVWNSIAERPVTRADAGKIIAARDRAGIFFACGQLVEDGFGLFIKCPSGVDDHKLTLAGVHTYALIPVPA